MKIGLYNLEPRVENTAMMQVSQYHKQQGDIVEIYNPLFKTSYDKVYAFSLFDYTDKGYVSKDMMCGGTGFDIKTKLPKEIETSNLDYSIFPQCETSYIWFSRGCVRNCEFCCVRQKEGNIHPVTPKNLNPKGKYISVMDNNFFANPKWYEAFRYLNHVNQPVIFSCGIDVRIFNSRQGMILKQLRLKRYFHIAWDNPKEDLRENIELLTKYVKKYKIVCYVLIGYWSTPEEDLYRVEELRKLGVEPFAMPYNKFDRYQRDFARWVNLKQLFKTISFKEYMDGKK